MKRDILPKLYGFAGRRLEPLLFYGLFDIQAPLHAAFADIRTDLPLCGTEKTSSGLRPGFLCTQAQNLRFFPVDKERIADCGENGAGQTGQADACESPKMRGQKRHRNADDILREDDIF